MSVRVITDGLHEWIVLVEGRVRFRGTLYAACAEAQRWRETGA